MLLDSSVLIAAYISRAGVCADLLEDVLMDHELNISELIVGEVARKLKEKFHFPDDEIEEVKNSILASAQCVEPLELPEDSCRDPNDLPVLGTAAAGHDDVLVTVDPDPDCVLLADAQWSTKLTVRDCTVKDLNHQLKALCRRNRDGSFGTGDDRWHMLRLMATQLHELGYQKMQATSLKPKHVEALISRWREQGISIGTLKNRLSVLRWWAGKVS